MTSHKTPNGKKTRYNIFARVRSEVQKVAGTCGNKDSNTDRTQDVTCPRGNGWLVVRG